MRSGIRLAVIRAEFGEGRKFLLNAYDMGMQSDPLPTPAQQKLLCEMIQHAFLEIRMLGWNGRAEQAADIADAFHNIPVAMCAEGFFSWAWFRRELEAYNSKWSTNKNDVGYYLKLLAEIECTTGG
jgi:hypothetical protein